MRKNPVLTLIGLALVGLLVACGTNESPDTGPAETAKPTAQGTDDIPANLRDAKMCYDLTPGKLSKMLGAAFNYDTNGEQLPDICTYVLTEGQGRILVAVDNGPWLEFCASLNATSRPLPEVGDTARVNTDPKTDSKQYCVLGQSHVLYVQVIGKEFGAKVGDDTLYQFLRDMAETSRLNG